MASFQNTLDEYGQSVNEWLDVAKKQATAVGKLQKAIDAGKAREIEKLREDARSLSESCAAKARECPSFSFDITEYMQRDDGYLAEFKEAAEKAELKIFERDGVIFCYPVLLRLEPKLGAVRIDKKQVNDLALETLVTILKKEQSSDPKANPEKFIKALFKAYELVVSKEKDRSMGADISLKDIYEALTILPGAEKEYTLLDFTRDLYFLDISGVTETKSYRMSLPASTVSREGNKKDILPFVTRDGHEKQYSAVKFVKSK
jgi:hypothetical protein